MNRRSIQKSVGFLTLTILLLVSYQNCAPNSLNSTGVVENASSSGTLDPRPPSTPEQFCAVSGGGMIPNGQSAIMYKTASAGCGATCESTTVTCTGTTLSRTDFPHLTCSQRLCATWDLSESSNLPVMSFSNGDLTVKKDDGTSAVRCSAYSSISASTGKYYFEVSVVELISGTANRIGIASRNGRVPNDAPIAAISYSFGNNGTYYSVVDSVSGTTPKWGSSTGFKKDDVVGVRVNHTENFIEFYVNGTLVGQARIQGGVEYAPFYFGAKDSNGVFRANFGATPFKYPPPAGYIKYETSVY